MKAVFLIIFVGLLMSCISEEKEPIDKVDSKWKEVGCLLYTNEDGDLAFLANKGMNKDDHEAMTEKYITHFGWQDTMQLKNVVDIQSFECLGDHFYRDKNRIYFHYVISDGGYFHIFTNSPDEFRMIGNYVFLRDSIMIPRKVNIAADAKTFKSSKEVGWLGKDKYHYFDYGDTVSLDHLKQTIPPEILQKLIDL